MIACDEGISQSTQNLSRCPNPCGRGRNFLKGYRGDQANAVLAAIGYNFRLLLAWLKLLLRLILAVIVESLIPQPRPKTAS